MLTMVLSNPTMNRLRQQMASTSARRRGLSSGTPAFYPRTSRTAHRAWTNVTTSTSDDSDSDRMPAGSLDRGCGLAPFHRVYCREVVDALAVFAEAARDLRRRTGEPTKTWLASSSGLSRQALDDLINGKRKPRWPTVVRYVQACKARAGSTADSALFTLERCLYLHAAADGQVGGHDFTVGRPPPVAQA